MIHVKHIQEIRLRLEDEFNPGPFHARTEAIAEAYRWGKELHAGQLRMSGEPYFETHCAWVAGFVDKLVSNEAWTIAALLHDSVEDQGETLEKIKSRFPGRLGEEIAYIVDGVTKISAPRDGRSREMETLRKIAQFRDPGVFLVKLADKSHNLLTLQHMPAHKREQKASEAIRAYGKLAGILNCYRWRRWIEDIAFPFAEPETYQFVKPIIDADPRLALNFINPMMDELGKIMDKAGVYGSVEITVNGYWQSWQKLRRMARARKTSMNSFQDVNDLVSFRLVVEDNDENACYALLPRINRFLGSYLDQNRFDDYIACPQNGYRALQVTAWLPDLGAVEVAIATRDMEGENHWGVVFALRHGKAIDAYRPVEILTPTGGARFLPEGSTVLDAVASIQQEFLLDKISAVKINGALARLSDRVQSGDIVEVISEGTRQTPNEKWLTFANNSTARLLRSVLITEALKQSADKGRHLIKPVLALKGILALEDIQALDPVRFDVMMSHLASSGLEDLYASLGSGAIRQMDLADALDKAGINQSNLNWNSISISGGMGSNRPGVLAQIAQLVSKAGGNIIRSVNNTRPDGGYYLRLVIKDLSVQQRETLRQSFLDSGIEFEALEVA